MGRFSPTVRPEPFDVPGIFDRAIRGYEVGRGIRRDRRHEREDEEDRNRYLAALRAQELSQPGASTLTEGLQRLNRETLSPDFQPGTADRPNDFRGDPSALTPETLQRVGRAGEASVPLQFRQPDPINVNLPSGETATYQERSPYMGASGVLMDPSRARQEQMLGRYLDAQTFRSPEPWELPQEEQEQRLDWRRRVGEAGRAPDELEPWELSPEDQKKYLEFEGARARATGRYQQRTKPGVAPRMMSYWDARSDLLAYYGVFSAESEEPIFPPGATKEWERQAIDAIRKGERPPPPPPEPITIAPPADTEPRGRGGVGKFLRGIFSREPTPEARPTGPPQQVTEALRTGEQLAPGGDVATSLAPISVSQAEYDAIAKEKGEEYTKRYFVVR